MATTPGITESDLLRQLDDATRGVADPNAPPAAQTIKIGDRTVSLADAAAVQQAFEEVQERSRRETEGLRQTVEQLQRTYAQPEHDTRPPAPTPPLPNMQPSSEWSVEQWAEAVRKDPVMATDQALARALKLPQGMTAAQALQGLAAALTTQTQELKQLKESTQQNRVLDDARLFVQTHDDYEPSPQNEQIIFDYCNQLGLNYDARGLDLAYLKAKADNAIQPKQSRGRATANEPEPEPQPQRGLPSVNRQNAATPTEDATLAAYYERLDKLPADEALKVVKNLYARQQR